MKAKPRTPDALKVHSHKKQYRLGWRSHISQTISIYAGRLGWKSSSKWATERTYIGFCEVHASHWKKSTDTDTTIRFAGCRRFVTVASIVVWRMSEVWVSGGLKNTREDMAMYPSLGYRGPTSSMSSSSYSRAPKSGGYNEGERDLVGDRLVLSYGSSVMRFLPLASKGIAHLSCCVARGGTLCYFLSVARCSTELGSLSPCRVETMD